MNKKNIIIIACFIIAMLLGAGLVLYPLIAVVHDEQVQSTIQTEYEEKIEQLDTSEFDEALKQAQEYNQTLANVQIQSADDLETLPKYEDLLNLAGNGIMGYIEIPIIQVNLPIYHGTTGSVMEKGAGHMLGTSLPVGGTGTHAVISAHCGMSTAKLFTDLDKLKEGDLFFITVCNEKLAYEVDDIKTVVPSDVDAIQIEADKDIVTLITCTPYGVNTHRLLVSGHRVEMTEEEITNTEESIEPEPSTWMQRYEQGIFIGILISLAVLLLLLVVLLIRRKAKRKLKRSS